ncbi:hemerythrin domain-containing protein [Actinoplanes sp. NPDC049681]|uniref:hemerythrin domain-containing protein n=1 Tax=Actinoplanes sp. NPDC049681 TaxID=3363905 RepID=UPI0037AE6CA8
MVLVHRVFRRELQLLPALVRAVPAGDVARAEVVGAHLHSIATALHHHHSGEDQLLWPLLLERAVEHTDLIRRMEAQHDSLHQPLARIAELNPRWRRLAAAADRDELADVLDRASASVDEHLTDEEELLLPLVPEFVTQREWDALGKHGRDGTPKGKPLLLFLGAILEDATPAERQRFLGQMPPPVRLIWRLLGDRLYRRTRDRVRAG